MEQDSRQDGGSGPTTAGAGGPQPGYLKVKAIAYNYAYYVVCRFMHKYISICNLFLFSCSFSQCWLHVCSASNPFHPSLPHSPSPSLSLSLPSLPPGPLISLWRWPILPSMQTMADCSSRQQTSWLVTVALSNHSVCLSIYLSVCLSVCLCQDLCKIP